MVAELLELAPEGIEQHPSKSGHGRIPSLSFAFFNRSSSHLTQAHVHTEANKHILSWSLDLLGKKKLLSRKKSNTALWL
jgi:hypothetical protein